MANKVAPDAAQVHFRMPPLTVLLADSRDILRRDQCVAAAKLRGRQTFDLLQELKQELDGSARLVFKAVKTNYADPFSCSFSALDHILAPVHAGLLTAVKRSEEAGSMLEMLKIAPPVESPMETLFSQWPS